MNVTLKFGLGLVAAAALVPSALYAAPCVQGQATVRRAAPAAPAVVARAPATGERRAFSYEPGGTVAVQPRYAAPTYVAPRAYIWHDNAVNSDHAANWKIRQ
jgi:hypothetical protein